MKYLFFLITGLGLGIFGPTQTFAANECRWKTWPQLAEAALAGAPEFKPLEKKRELAHRRVDAAGLGPMPRIAAQYLNGTAPTNSGEGEVSYEWTIENRDKRSARTDAARSEIAVTDAEIEEKKTAILLDLAILSERIHQINHERETLGETLGTYKTLLKQYDSFPALSPEQNVTVSIFRLARDETQLKLGQLKVETENYSSIIRQMTGCAQVSLPAEARKERKTWPRAPEANGLTRSVTLKRIETKQQAAKGHRDAELQQTATDYSIGPIARWNRDEGEQNLSFGVAFSMPLSNQRQVLGSSAQASYEVVAAEGELETKRLAADLEKWTTQYRNAVDILGEGFAEVEVFGKHAVMEKAFVAGRVNASLVIEAHRQMFEHMVSRHQIEMKASEALWNIRFLTGTLSKDDL